MSEPIADRRASLLHLAAVFAVLVVLVILLFGTRLISPPGVKPLQPSDPMSLWYKASPAEKQATAEQIVAELEKDFFGPRQIARLARPHIRQRRVDSVILALDEASNIDLPAYVSPSQSMLLTVENFGRKRRWQR